MGNKYGDIRYKWLAEKGFKVKSDEHQLAYVQSLFDDINNVKTVFVNAKAGTGKTTLAVLCGIYAVEKGEYDRIIYLRNALSVRDQGFLPGDVTEKENVYFQPLYDAFDKVDSNLFNAWVADEENPKVVARTTSYLRGVNFENAYVVLDECQNMNMVEMQTILTRPHDNCKTVAIGSTLQNDDNNKNLIKGHTPFELYMMHYQCKVYNRTHELLINYRGDVSSWADEINRTIKVLENKK